MRKKKKSEIAQDNTWRLAPDLFAKHLSNGRWTPYDYLVYISKQIVDALAEGDARLIISAPPRHGKSLLSSYWTPAWYLNLFPHHHVILASYSAEIATGFGREVRNLVNARGDELEFSLREDSKSASRWNTNFGGSMTTVGIGGSLTGKGGHLIVLDDMVKDHEQAMSPTFRERAINWYNSVLHTRLEPGASVILLMTRWHKRDLSGYLLSEHPDEWTEITLPALAEEDDPLGRAPGEALNPDRYSAEKLLNFRAAMGPSMFNSIYQQKPSSEEGNEIKRRYIKFYRELPSNLHKIQSWDMAFKDNKPNSFVVGDLWGKVVKGADVYLIDQVRAQMDFNATLAAVQSFSAKHPDCAEILIEGKANGPAVMSVLRDKLMGMVETEPEGSKESRVAAVSPYWEAGNIWLPHPDIAPWIHDVIEEYVNFPKGTKDDRVDTMTQALLRLSGRLVGDFWEKMVQNKGKTIVKKSGGEQW